VVPIDLLDTFNEAWCLVCDAYEVSAELPDMASLFAGVDLSIPAQTSEMVLANILTEVMEHIGRFSPWYRKPVGAFGLTLVQNPATHRKQWTLTSGAVHQWQPVLKRLSVAIERNKGLILSASLLESLERDDDNCVMAHCTCTPPRVILVSRSILLAQIRCDNCQHVFELVEDAPSPGYRDD
jgi:hypothetical protein